MRFAVVNVVLILIIFSHIAYIYTSKGFSSTYIQGRSSNYRKQLSGDDIYCGMRKMRQK